MQWILNNFELVALVVLAIGSAIKQFAEAAKSRREMPPRREEAEEEYEEQPTWIPIPIPPEYQAPPPLPKSPPPLLAPLFSPQVVVEDADEVLRKQREMEEKIRELKERKAQARQATARPGENRRKVSSPVPTDIRGVLRKPSSARQAIVLREIIGAPVGLR